MVIIHAFLALLSGFATMALLIAGLSYLTQYLIPSWANDAQPLTDGYAFVNLAGAFVAAAAGGYVTAWAAPMTTPMQHVLALALAVLALAALTALQSRGKLPIWYLLSLIVMSPLGIVVGGLIRLRAVGILS